MYVNEFMLKIWKTRLKRQKCLIFVFVLYHESCISCFVVEDVEEVRNGLPDRVVQKLWMY